MHALRNPVGRPHRSDTALQGSALMFPEFAASKNHRPATW